MKISEITQEKEIKKIIEVLKEKTGKIPSWDDLEKEYKPTLHPVMDTAIYPDKTTKEGIEKVTRITLGLQRLATKRITGLMFGIPVKRVYSSESEGEKKVAKLMEKIFNRNRIDKINRERSNLIYAGCEMMTLWYSVEGDNVMYGEPSKVKLRSRNYSPMNGDNLYPLLDETDDMIAMSIGYTRKKDGKDIEYFDTYTSDEHIRWNKEEGDWAEEVREKIELEKIPAIYYGRQMPIWEDTSNNVYEMEWLLSRNGNYIHKNSKPIFGVFADDEVDYGGEKKDDSRLIIQYPKGSDAKYITWDQATESLKLQIEELKKSYFMQLQLPDISHENMKTAVMSGESRKMMFMDAQLKVTEESGSMIEMLDREVNVVKEFMKLMWPKLKTDIETIQVEQVITPYQISNDKELINNLMAATGGNPIVSQKEAIERLGWSDDTESTINGIKADNKLDTFEPTD